MLGWTKPDLQQWVFELYGTDPQQSLLVNTLPPQQTWKVKQSTIKIFIIKNVLRNPLMEFDLAPAQLQNGSWSTSQSS